MIFGFTWKSRIQQWINGWLHVCFCSVQLSLPLHKYLWSSSTCTIKNGISVSGGNLGYSRCLDNKLLLWPRDRDGDRDECGLTEDEMLDERGEGWMDGWMSESLCVPLYQSLCSWAHVQNLNQIRKQWSLQPENLDDIQSKHSIVNHIKTKYATL